MVMYVYLPVVKPAGQRCHGGLWPCVPHSLSNRTRYVWTNGQHKSQNIPNLQFTTEMICINWYTPCSTLSLVTSWVVHIFLTLCSEQMFVIVDRNNHGWSSYEIIGVRLVCDDRGFWLMLVMLFWWIWCSSERSSGKTAAVWVCIQPGWFATSVYWSRGRPKVRLRLFVL